MKPLYIFDLDGTLALIDHRKHFITGEVKDWDAFNAACVDDAPNHGVIETMKILAGGGAQIWIFTGRDSFVREQTIEWLVRHTHFLSYQLKGSLVMRNHGDHRDDTELKASWLDAIPPLIRARLAATFEDRDRVVAMWRSKGITCFQVAPGNF